MEVPEEKQLKWRNILYEEQPYLENVYPGETKNIDTMFVIKDYTFEYFCLLTRPITREYFEVGNAKLKSKGYRIADACNIEAKMQQARQTLFQAEQYMGALGRETD